MIYTARVDNFYLTPEALAASPSRADGIDEATEQELRHYCCDVVAEAAVLLRLPQVVAVTAQVLVQRFYCKRSLKKFDVTVGAAAGALPRARRRCPSRPLVAALACELARLHPASPLPRPAPQHVAMAAFWLACKLEEVIEIDNPQRLSLRAVIQVVDRIVRRRDGRSLAIMDPYSQARRRWAVAAAAWLAGWLAGCWQLAGGQEATGSWLPAAAARHPLAALVLQACSSASVPCFSSPHCRRLVSPPLLRPCSGTRR